jgi:hypothetical protein
VCFNTIILESFLTFLLCFSSHHKGDEVVEAITEYLGSSSFKVIAHVKEKGIVPIRSIRDMGQDDNTADRREDTGDRDIMSSTESRDGLGELSVLTEPPKLLSKKSSASSRRKSVLRFFKRKGVGAEVEPLKTIDASTNSCKDNAALLSSVRALNTPL